MALEIRTSLRPERPGTTPEGEARSKKEGERERGGARALTTRTSLRPEESEAGKRGKTSKERRGETVRREKGKGHKTPIHRGSKEREEQTTKEQKRGGVTAKSITGTRGQQGETKSGEALTVRTSLRPEKPGTWRKEKREKTTQKRRGQEPKEC